MTALPMHYWPKALDDRRQRAREAGYDACAVSMPTESESAAIEAAIETATRVRVDDELVELGRAALAGGAYGYLDHHAARVIIEAAFRAAGFEVEA